MTEEIKNPIEQYRERFRSLRDDFIDDLPDEIVTASDPNYHRYKCRGNYFQGVIASLENLLNDGLVKGKLADRVYYFIKSTEGRDWKRKTTKEEVDEVNKLLDDLIASLP